MSALDARLQAVVERRPDALALRSGEREWSYADLAALVDHSATELTREGLGRGHFIGWLGLNSPEMLAMLFACARLGAVLVPLNWRLAAAELAEIARHAGLSALKGTPEMKPLADALRSLVPVPAPAEPAQGGDVLLVYTSGTTGHPKGAVHTQAGMLANIDAALAVQPIDETSRVLAVLPLFHVGGLCIQVLPALASGAAIDLHPRFEPGAWLRDVAAWRASTSLLVPAVMRALIENADWMTTELSSLRFVNSGSSIVPLPLIEAFHARGVPVAQVYGGTETGPVSIALAPRDALTHAGRVGWPAPGVSVRLAADGELLLKAPNLMRGYHRSDEPSFDADGWFHTGDLATRRDDGSFEIVGRAKDLIISGGENIHPAEIESAVACWPGVAEAAVVGLPDARWGEVPVLALVAQPGHVVDLSALRQMFEARLARFKHPRRIVLMQALPKTALGKVRKSELVDALIQIKPAAP